MKEFGQTHHVADLRGAAGPNEDDVVASAGLELVGRAADGAAQLSLGLFLRDRRVGKGGGGQNESAEKLHGEVVAFESAWTCKENEREVTCRGQDGKELKRMEAVAVSC